MRGMTDRGDHAPEPEIIPPGVPIPRDRPLWAAADTGQVYYVHTSRVGPVGLALLTLGVGAVAVLAILFLLSAAFVGFAAIGVVSVGVLLARILHRPKHPLR
jgi:hypothetical protein